MVRRVFLHIRFCGSLWLPSAGFGHMWWCWMRIDRIKLLHVVTICEHFGCHKLLRPFCEVPSNSRNSTSTSRQRIRALYEDAIRSGAKYEVHCMYNKNMTDLECFSTWRLTFSHFLRCSKHTKSKAPSEHKHHANTHTHTKWQHSQ